MAVFDGQMERLVAQTRFTGIALVGEVDLGLFGWKRQCESLFDNAEKHSHLFTDLIFYQETHDVHVAVLGAQMQGRIAAVVSSIDVASAN